MTFWKFSIYREKFHFLSNDSNSLNFRAAVVKLFPVISPSTQFIHPGFPLHVYEGKQLSKKQLKKKVIHSNTHTDMDGATHLQ